MCVCAFFILENFNGLLEQHCSYYNNMFKFRNIDGMMKQLWLHLSLSVLLFFSSFLFISLEGSILWTCMQLKWVFYVSTVYFISSLLMKCQYRCDMWLFFKLILCNRKIALCLRMQEAKESWVQLECVNNRSIYFFM